jgi:hypothetical protein
VQNIHILDLRPSCPEVEALRPKWAGGSGKNRVAVGCLSVLQGSKLSLLLPFALCQPGSSAPSAAPLAARILLNTTSDKRHSFP